MIQNAFGCACKYYREKMNLSQEKFALLASVEAGKRNISIQNIKKISDGFSISVSKLLKKAEEYDG